MKNYILVLAIFTLVVVLGAEEPYKLVIHNTDPDAKCLDGTSPSLYYHEGGDLTRFLVFF